MIIIDCKEFPTIQAFLEHALLQQQALLDGQDDVAFQQLKDHNDTQEIRAEFKHTQTCHDFYRPCKCVVTARKPRRSKPSVTNKADIFYYYLTRNNKTAAKFYTMTDKKQTALVKSFTKAAPTSSKQAMDILAILIK